MKWWPFNLLNINIFQPNGFLIGYKRNSVKSEVNRKILPLIIEKRSRKKPDQG